MPSMHCYDFCAKSSSQKSNINVHCISIWKQQFLETVVLCVCRALNICTSHQWTLRKSVLWILSMPNLWEPRYKIIHVIGEILIPYTDLLYCRLHLFMSWECVCIVFMSGGIDYITYLQCLCNVFRHRLLYIPSVFLYCL